MRLAADERPALAQRVAAGRLDLQYLGAEIGEDAAGEVAGFVGEIEHAQPVEGAIGGIHIGCLPQRRFTAEARRRGDIGMGRVVPEPNNRF